jgi:hypothetical protein
MNYLILNDEMFVSAVMSGRIERFGHLEHLRLAFLCARGGETLDEVVDGCRAGIQAVAAARGAPAAYDETVTVAWAGRMLGIVQSMPGASLDAVLARHPELAEVRPPSPRHPTSGRSATHAARPAAADG